MDLSIKTNLNALGSLNALRKGSEATRQTFARLSSGSRITTARDDASGLAISNNLRLDLASARSALTNITQAASVIQIADSGLSSIQGKINRMNELAALAASSTLTNSERNHLDAEFQTLKQAIAADTQSTSFNGENLLGERPDFALGPVGSDINTDDGIIGFQFNNGGLFVANDVIEVTYNATTGIFQLENTNTSYRETLAAPTALPAGNTFDLNFVQLGITLTLSNEFDFATNIDPAVDDATFIIRANDPLAPGFTPNDLNNLAVNISGEDSVINIVGVGVQSISDLEVTGGNNQAQQGAAGARPTVDFGGIFGRDALDFDGVNDILTIANSAAINVGTQAQRVIAFNFETGADVATRQVIFEEGAGINGLNAYIQGGQLFFGVYRANGAIASFASTAIAANTQYTASFDFDSVSNNVRAYLDGAEFANQAGIGAALPSHTGGIGLGGVNGSTRIAGAVNVGAVSSFQGKIGDFLLYNDTFSAADHGNLDLYLRNNAAPAVAGFSNESLAFQIDHAQGEQLIYRKPQTDFLLVQLSSLDITSIGNANIALDELRGASNFLSDERSKIGSLLSQLEFATAQVTVFQENTANANSVLRDADIAKETTQAASDVLRDRVNVLVLSAALESGGQLLSLLNSGL